MSGENELGENVGRMNGVREREWSERVCGLIKLG